MIFGSNTVSVNKANQKLQDKGQIVIDARISETQNFDINHAIQESSSMLFNRPLGRSASRRMLISKRAKIQESVTKSLFKENLFNLFKGSLLLDEDFKLQQESNLYKFFDNTFNNMMNENYFSWDSIKNNSCAFTKKLYSLCEDTANLTADKLVNMDTVKNAKASKDALISEKEDKDDENVVEEEDKKEIDEKTKDDKKQVEKVVKDKVVKTIKDEKEAAEKEKEEDEEIKEKSKTKKEKESENDDNDEKETDSNSEESEDSEGESDSSSNEDESEGDSDEGETSDEDKDKNEEGSDETKSEGVELLLKRVRHPNKLRNESFFKSIQINVANKFMNEKREGLIGEDVNINMDMIFAESIVYYTLLETLNTINIVNFTPSQAKKVCRELILS